ncbi:hypothetical protein JB92DRAFT_2952469 [Gautieria morchelliformis]|nr:hypothetical protein JB92DRAFT_2952469 [Gautieria morchelliformis]
MPVTLVEDLVSIILDLAHWTTAELIILSLVSPAWLQPARRRLYRHPTITSAIQCRYLVRTLQSVEALQCLVKGINLWLEEAPQFARELVAIRFMLGLEGLDCVSFLSPSATSLMQKIIRTKPVRRIVILPIQNPFQHRIDDLHLPSTPSMVEWHPKLAEKFISLEKLAISGAKLHITPSHATQYEFHLSHLIISQCNIIHGSLPELLSPASWSHLRNLTIITDSSFSPDTYGMATLLSYCGEALQSFHLEYRTSTVANDFNPLNGLFRDALEGQGILVSLRRLHLVDVISLQACLTALQKIGQRCPHLEVLKITGRHWPSFTLQALAWPVNISDARLIFPRLMLLEGPSKVFRVDEEDLASNSAADDCDEEWQRDIPRLVYCGTTMRENAVRL